MILKTQSKIILNLKTILYLFFIYFSSVINFYKKYGKTNPTEYKNIQLDIVL